MDDRVWVDLRYKTDLGYRRIEPHALYFSSPGKVSVSCDQISNANDPAGRGPHNFEVGLIADLDLTDVSFVPDPRFDRNIHSV